jgi:hypothetical protein
MAAELSDQTAQETLLLVARSYDRLAELSAEKAKTKPDGQG